MLRLIACFLLFIGASGTTISLSSSHNGRIVNGVDTSIEAHPYQVSIHDPTGKHFCGGSIYKEDIIITAAHCVNGYVFDPTELTVRLGSTNCKNAGELINVADVRVHERYNSYNYDNDVALIKLAKPVSQTNRVRYIGLAIETPKAGAAAIVTGWGAKCFGCDPITEILQRIDIKIIDWQLCASNKYKHGARAITSNMVCATTADNKDACQNDSGGPLVSNSQLVGIVSFGNKGCGDPNYPGVYTDVSKLRNWIEHSTAELKAV